MDKPLKYVMAVLVIGVLVCASNFAIFALNTDENAGFITRDEFNEWQEQFIASLSELDKESTNKIYDDMKFYDMQYRFTGTYKTGDYLTDDGKPTAKLQEMILKEKAKRGKL